MKNKNHKSIAAALLITAVALTSTARAEDDIQSEAQQAIANFQAADSSLKQYFDTSAGYAVFPSVGKGGFVVGGARGKGVLYEKGKAIGRTTLTQASIGAQAGGQSFAEVIFFETPHALEDFKSGQFEMSADVSAVAAAEGAAKSAKYKNGVMVSALPKKGLMFQASVGGQKFKYEPLR
ncbi:MAG TPA: YSC84-related protein [Verrucomicrobiae bacterium]|jgi:lipid-binding SYLF domain-containing protein|nr:YSC84-related protein [Verrucomicrobiae bacterium]